MSKMMTLALALSLLAFRPGPALADTPSPRTETRVYTRKQCLVSKADVEEQKKRVRSFGLGAVASIFVPLLVNKLFGGVSSALKKAAADETERDYGRLPTYLYQLSEIKGVKQISSNPNLGCVVVVRGTFTGPDRGDQTEVDFSSRAGVLDGAGEEGRAQRRQRLRDSNIPVDSIAALYEAEIIESDDKTALRYESRFLEVATFQGDDPKKGQRTMVVSLAVYGAGAREGEPTLSLSLMNMGQVTPGTVLGPDKLAGRRSSWLGGVGLTEASLKAVERMDVDAENPVKGVMPVTFEGMFAETKKGSTALKFISEVFDAAREELGKNVSDEILRDRGKEAEAAAAAAADAQEKLRLEEEAAYAACLEATVSLKKAQSPTPEEDIALRFNVNRLHRVWKLKFDALQKLLPATMPARVACEAVPPQKP